MGWYNFKDRVSTKPKRKKIEFENGSIEYAVIDFADEPKTEGTKLNRESLMAMQDLTNKTTMFNPDGTITINYEIGTTVTTTFNPDGSITTKIQDKDGDVTTKTTTFQADGSIKEVMS